MFQDPNQPTKEFLDAQVQAMQTLVSPEAAQAAIEWVSAGDVQRKPASRLLREDRWSVGDTTCSVGGRYCACEPARTGAVPQQQGGGPLCEHRLAAIVMAKWEKTHGQASPIRLLQALIEHGGDIRLRVHPQWTYRFGDPQSTRLLAYFVDGRWRELPAAQQPTFPYFDLHKLLDERTWFIQSSVDRKVYAPGVKDVVWFLAPRTVADQVDPGRPWGEVSPVAASV